jgi:hypothetical protein
VYGNADGRQSQEVKKLEFKLYKKQEELKRVYQSSDANAFGNSTAAPSPQLEAPSPVQQQHS